MPPQRRKKRKKGLKKWRESTQCTMISLSRSLLRESKKKSKWLGRPLKLCILAIISKKKFQLMTLFLKLCSERELSALSCLSKRKTPNNSLPWNQLTKMTLSKRIRSSIQKHKRWSWSTLTILFWLDLPMLSRRQTNCTSLCSSWVIIELLRRWIALPASFKSKEISWKTSQVLCHADRPWTWPSPLQRFYLSRSQTRKRIDGR